MKNVSRKDLSELKRWQEQEVKRLRFLPLENNPRLIAGADVSYDLSRGLSFGVMVVLKWPSLRLVAQSVAVEETPFPYIPGFLSFREVPVLKKAFFELETKPEVILVDGQGVLHPRQFGLACHLGLELECPTIGVAKKPLIGEFKMPPDKKGAYEFVYHLGEKKGVVLRTRPKTKPVFISPGHLIDLDSSLRVVLSCLKGYRLPEPLRQAHLLSQRVKK